MSNPHARWMHKGVYYKGNRFTEKRFDRYTQAIGQVALAWNDLYEEMARLFITMMGGRWVQKPLALWHSATLDRPKRLMLMATIQHLTAAELQRFPKMAEDIKWIVDRVTALEDNRNTAVHSPLYLINSKSIFLFALGPNPPDALPQTLNSNPRALRLLEKDVLAEYRWTRDAILLMRDFTHRVDRALSAKNVPWPDRPKMPSVKPKTAPRGLRRRLEKERRARQPQASNE